MLMVKRVTPYRFDVTGRPLVTLTLGITPRNLSGVVLVAIANVNVVLVTLVGEERSAADREWGADLAGTQRPGQLIKEPDEAAGGRAGGADGLVVDLVEVDRAPFVVVADSGGAFDVLGVAGLQAGDAELIALLGEEGEEAADADVEVAAG